MSDWKPKVRANLRWETLNLNAEEGFLLSRIDGATSVEGLTHLTGLSASQVTAVLDKLADGGALEGPARAAPRTIDFADVPKTSAQRSEHGGPAVHDLDDDITGDDQQAVIQAALADLGDDLFDSDDGDAVDDGDAHDADDTDEGAAVGSIMDGESVEAGDEYGADDARGQIDLGDDDSSSTDDAGERHPQEDANVDDDVDDKPDEGTDVKEAEEVEEGNYRKLFETTLHGLPLEEREALAREAKGPTALAFCFDPVPNVILRLMENSEVGFPHARLIARHHRTSQGLDTLFKRSELVRDQQVQRWLMSNPMLSDPQLKRLLAPKILSAVYKWTRSRDLPEKNRTKVRLILRSKWSVADGEERASLIFQTEGRCLAMLIGLQLDSKATTLLCQRSINSVMLIQSLCRFTSTPPPVLNHLMRQAVVKRQPNLKMMILQHPNCPSEHKRAARSPTR